MESCGAMYEINAMNTIDVIREAFRGRVMPAVMVSSLEVSPEEYREVMILDKRHWSSITCEELDHHHEIVFWLSPMAFCYFLPGIMSAGIKEGRPDLLVNYSIIGMLDRTPEPDYWDSFFVERWPLLSMEECEAVQEWVFWLSSFKDLSFYENSFERALDTLDCLKKAKRGRLG